MPIIDKVSSLRNYQAVLDKIQPGNPVFLTKNGTGRYAIVDITEYDFLYKTAFDKFFEQMDSARAQANRDGWVSEDALRKHYGIAR
jgi:hypothetical protein